MTPRNADLPLNRVSLRNEWVNLCFVVAVLLTVYLRTMPRNIVMEDTSIFVMASHFLGTAHPPGYPLVVLSGKLFSYLPVGSLAFRVHLVSAFFAVLTCIALYLTARSVFVGRLAATTAAIGLGLSQTFWSQAIIAEAYTLNTFLFSLLFAVCVVIRSTGDPKWMPLLCFIYGLSLANHWPLIQLSLPALLIFLWPHRRLIRTHAFKSALCFLCGLSPYALMVAMSQRGDGHSFAGAITSVQEFASFVSRQMYVAVDDSPSATWRDKILFLKFYASEFLAQFTIFGAALAGFGVVRLRKLPTRSLLTASVLIFLSQTLLIVLLLDFDFDPTNQSVIVVYPLIAYGIAALWIAIALDYCFTRFPNTSAAVPALKVVLSVGFLVTLHQANIEANDRHQDRWAVQYAKTALQSLPEHAILFTHGDLDAGPLEYLHQIEGIRRDVTLVNDQGLGFSTKLFSPLQRPQRGKRLREFIDRQNRPLFYTDEYFPHPYRRGRFGFLFRIVKNPARTPQTIVEPSHLELLEDAAELPYRDPWIDAHIELLTAYTCSTITRSAYETPRQNTEHAVLSEMFCRGFLPKLYRARDLIVLDPRNDALIGSAMAELKELEPEEPSKQLRSWFHVIQGNHMAARDRSDRAVIHYRNALDIYPHHTNEALFLLLAHYADAGDFENFTDLKDQFFGTRRLPRKVKELEDHLKSTASPDSSDSANQPRPTAVAARASGSVESRTRSCMDAGVIDRRSESRSSAAPLGARSLPTPC